MRGKKSYIPYKVILGYLLLLVLVSVTGYLIYSENAAFSSTENKVQLENKKILKVSTLFSKMYETESQARLTILSNSDKDYQNYIAQTNELKLDIDTLKTLLTTKYQIVLLDSVKYLLNKKTNNIQQLKIIKNKASEEIAVKNAINDLTKMEVSLQKLRLEDFVKNPASLGEYQRSVLIKYVDYLNQNIPSDDTNTLSQKALDSMLTKSRKLLTDVKRETSIRNENLNKEEKKLLENELSASEQLRKIIRLIENEILIKNTQNSAEKEASLKKTNEVVSSAAIIGLLLTILFSVLVLSDFSKSQSYKKQLEQANLKTKNLLRNREQLIATVSHDLKTPLNTIIGYSELLTTSDLTAKQSYFTKNIKTASDYIAHLVQDLVDLTQIEAGKIALESSAFSLTELLTETAHNIQSNYDSKKIKLQFDLDEKLQQNIISDSFRIMQIITNIIGNAYKFTEVGYIKISAKVNTENNKVSVYIEDSGIGIETSKQDLIFEEFTQANDSIEKKYGGTGLGLTISKKLAQILGGNLFLKSTVDKGSTFTITIPIEFAAIQKPKLKNPKEFLASDFTIIILDDDANLLQLTNEILKQKGFQTVTFTNGSDALQFAKQTPFDLVVTDIQMPEMDGFEFLMQLQKEDNLFKNQPIIAITGRTDLPNSDYITAGFKTVIAKPYLPENFLEIIKNVLQNSGDLKTILTASVYQEINQDLYSLDDLKAFFPDESNVIQEILVAFITNTRVNLKLIQQFCSENNLEEIKEIAHKMYPMFKQIKSDLIANLLEDLEKNTNTIKDATVKIEKIKEKIALLLEALKAEIN